MVAPFFQSLLLHFPCSSLVWLSLVLEKLLYACDVVWLSLGLTRREKPKSPWGEYAPNE